MKKKHIETLTSKYRKRKLLKERYIFFLCKGCFCEKKAIITKIIKISPKYFMSVRSVKEIKIKTLMKKLDISAILIF